MYKFADKKTGEIIENIYATKEGELKRIHYDRRNYIIRETADGKVELCFFDKPFIVPVVEDYVTSDEDLMAFEAYCARRHFKNVDGVAVPIDDKGTFKGLRDSFKRGTKRAIKTFYDYALGNDWEYFVTLTFRDKDVRNSLRLMSDTWLLFTRGLKRKFPDFKAIATYEEFEKGGYHIHSMLSDCDLTLKPARNNDKDSKDYGKFIYSEFGPQIMNCIDWSFGFNTVVCLDPKSNQAQIVNYMSKYMTKDSPAGYGNRRFYKTQNLKCRDSIVGTITRTETLDNIVEKFGLKFVKEDKSGNYYFRNY